MYTETSESDIFRAIFNVFKACDVIKAMIPQFL